MESASRFCAVPAALSKAILDQLPFCLSANGGNARLQAVLVDCSAALPWPLAVRAADKEFGDQCIVILKNQMAADETLEFPDVAGP